MGPPKPPRAATAPTSRRGRFSRCGWRRSGYRIALGRGFRRAKIADLAGEFDPAVGDLASESDLNVVALNVQRLDERHRVAFNLAVLQFGFAFLAVGVDIDFAGHFRTVLLEREGVFLQSALRFEFGLPSAGDIGCVSRWTQESQQTVQLANSLGYGLRNDFNRVDFRVFDLEA